MISLPVTLVATPIAFTLDLMGSVLKLGWRLVVFTAALRVVLTLPVRTKVSYLLAKGARLMATACVGVSEAADRWHAANLQKTAPAPPPETSPPASAPQQPQRVRKMRTSQESPVGVATPADSLQAKAADARKASASVGVEADDRERASKMRVRAIKEELDALGVDHTDVLEKSDLVDRLVEARRKPPRPASPQPPPPPPPPQAAPSAGPPADNPFANGAASAADFEGAFNQFASQVGVDPQAAQAQAEKMAADPAGMELLAKLQSNPRVMEAVMDMVMNGEAAATKYANDAEVMSLLQEMETLQTKLDL